jgi:hypothetical protein
MLLLFVHRFGLVAGLDVSGCATGPLFLFGIDARTA